MVTDQEISQAVQSLFRESNPRTFTTLNEVVQQLQAKLGTDLTHKADFITNQINLLFGSHPPRPPAPPAPQQQQQPPRPLLQPHHHPQPPSKDHFAPHQNPNFQTAPTPVTSAFQSFASHATPAKPDAAATDGTGPETAGIAGTDVSNESTQTKAKRRGGPGGLNKLCGVSPELQVIVGQPALPRTEIVKQLWAYIRKNNLQDPSNKRKIICNDELRVVFETDCTDMFKMNKLLAKHIIPLEPTKQPVPKKQKVDVESGTKSAEPAPSVMISDALANFFGITGREMLQSEVLRRIWEYIKVNQLEDPLTPMAIRCDAKLQELFGCERISALGIPEVLGRHHIFRRSDAANILWLQIMVDYTFSAHHLVNEKMAQTSGKALVQWLVAAMLIVLLGGARAVVLCHIDSAKLNLCRAAVTGQYPPPPTAKCCAVIRHANLPCLCRYKSVLPAVGINPTNALALPSKCGLKTPPGC